MLPKKKKFLSRKTKKASKKRRKQKKLSRPMINSRSRPKKRLRNRQKTSPKKRARWMLKAKTIPRSLKINPLRLRLPCLFKLPAKTALISWCLNSVLRFCFPRAKRRCRFNSPSCLRCSPWRKKPSSCQKCQKLNNPQRQKKICFPWPKKKLWFWNKPSIWMKKLTRPSKWKSMLRSKRKKLPLRSPKMFWKIVSK